MGRARVLAGMEQDRGVYGPLWRHGCNARGDPVVQVLMAACQGGGALAVWARAQAQVRGLGSLVSGGGAGVSAVM